MYDFAMANGDDVQKKIAFWIKPFLTLWITVTANAAEEGVQGILCNN